LANWIKKEDPTICCLQETHLIDRNKYWLRLKGLKIYQNLWDTANAVLRGKFIAISAYIKRSERSQINDLTLPLKLLEKQKQANPKTTEGKKQLRSGLKSMK
jgi:hypothetical protein